ncbi:hypothetical protein CMI47_00620 [Candidatus Pacearchaeota archaeon]|nr:hypothetical protein [Candidatus Pacearchaeota archaeon]|tara:strand:- start:727 stop:1242 length:516 start_codon:yes stop_codon:yes gene_type:complete
MAVDISSVALIAPVVAFLLVFVVVFAILARTKILGESAMWLNIFISLFIAALFISFAGVKDLVLTIVPWFAVLVIALFLILVLTRFAGNVPFIEKGAGVVFVILLGIVFIVSAFVVFNDTLLSYIPGPGYGEGASEGALFFADWLFSSRVLGAIVLVIASAIVAWVLVKAK